MKSKRYDYSNKFRRIAPRPEPQESFEDVLPERQEPAEDAPGGRGEPVSDADIITSADAPVQQAADNAEAVSDTPSEDPAPETDATPLVAELTGSEDTTCEHNKKTDEERGVNTDGWEETEQFEPHPGKKATSPKNAADILDKLQKLSEIANIIEKP